MFHYLKEQLDTISHDIECVCKDINVDPRHITLIGVTKTYEPDVINAALGYGLKHIAENRVQEITRKYPDVKKACSWHLIGHLQTNKVKYIIDKVDLIHSLDSERLADEIDRRAKAIGKVQDVLIQVNVADETQKHGIRPDELPQLLAYVARLENIRVCGLMNIAPDTDDSSLLEWNFKTMKTLYDHLKTLEYVNLDPQFLSMGMSNDYDIALKSGANMLRIGTKLFGKRQSI